MTNQERPLVLAAHLGTLIGGFWVPLLIWLFKKEESPIISVHAKASLNFQISMTLYMLIAVMLTFFAVGIPFLFLIPIVDLVCVILATIEADKGSLFNYPLSITFVK